METVPSAKQRIHVSKLAELLINKAAARANSELEAIAMKDWSRKGCSPRQSAAVAWYWWADKLMDDLRGLVFVHMSSRKFH
jgi:hypothetical protein